MEKGTVVFIFVLIATNVMGQRKSVVVSRPNILLINIDDLGWRDLGYMGSHYYETPNIDKLASEGMIFTNAYAAASNCAPSRASLFSGQWASRTGIYTVDNSDRGKSENRKLVPIPNTEFLRPDVLTITQVLKQHGYTTCHAGKWHISRDPTQFGFDVNIGGAEYGHPPHGYFSPWHNRALKDGPPGQYLTDHIADLAIEFLKTTGDKPFFLNYAPYAVHYPLQGKPELVEKFRHKEGSYGQNDPVYAAMIETMDSSVGRIINYLKESGKFSNTFIIFASDNGGVYGTTHQWPLRAGKGSYYEGGVRIPVIIVWPGKVRPGSSTNEPVVNTDFFPTLLQVASITKPKNKILDGRSILPVLKDKMLPPQPIFWDFPIYLETSSKVAPEDNLQWSDPCFRTRPGSSVRSGPWVLQQYYEDDHLELYNLDIDIGERNNLVEKFPAKTQELYRLLVQWRQEAKVRVPTTLNPDYREGGCLPNINSGR